jgi:lactoylglutathione lyase
MRYLHTMVRARDLDESLRFYRDGLGLQEVHRIESEKGRFTLVFLAAPADVKAAGGWPADGHMPTGLPCIELTYNWDPENYTGGRNFGHLAYRVEDVYAACEKLQGLGVTINRPPRDGHMAFVRSPDGVSIELLQEGEHLPAKEPWASMANTGSW